MEAATSDERVLAEALVAVRRLATCHSLPSFVHQATNAFEDLLALYAPARSLRAVPPMGEES